MAKQLKKFLDLKVSSLAKQVLTKLYSIFFIINYYYLFITIIKLAIDKE